MRIDGVPHPVAVAACREELTQARAGIEDGGSAPGEDALAAAASKRARQLLRPGPRRVINATGVVLHTNLGRAPLGDETVAAIVSVAAGYCDLEYDLEAGGRGSRGAHLEPLLRELSGAEAALAVNNNAAAVMLALAAIAGEGEVLVSRGQLVEIGGSFRIPDILAHSGATLVEVGTTNRTRLEDYERAIGARTTAILSVHQSNFRIVGFVEQPTAQELAGLAQGHNLALIDDLGSGALEQIGDEPTVEAAVTAGADLVCCSGDKLLGGPQAGLLFGRREAVDRCRCHPLARALRLDKLQIAALSATLIAHREHGRASVPALRMIDASEEELAQRVETMAAAIGAPASIERDGGAPGGGTLADVTLPGPVCSVETGALGADGLLSALRRAEPPVIARVVRGRAVLDPRTMSDEDAVSAAAAVRTALG